MIWNHFPVGLNFSVADFSEKTKRECWKLALSALAAVDAEQYAEMKLYDLCTEGAPASAEKEYVCILDHRHVTQSRVTLAAWKKMPALFAKLSLHFPFYQANALDPFAGYPLLAEVLTDGSLNRSETGKTLLPERLPEPLRPGEGRKVLIAGKVALTPLGWADSLKKSGETAAESGAEVSYLPYAEGGIGTTYAVGVARRGRFEWLESINTAGETAKILFAAVPNFTVIFDCASVLTPNGATVAPSRALGEAIRKLLDYGYRNMILPMADFTDTDGGEALLEALSTAEDPEKIDPRLADTHFVILTADGSVPETGSAKRLKECGAEVVSAADALFEQLNLARRAADADEIRLTDGEADPIAQRLLAARANAKQ